MSAIGIGIGIPFGAPKGPALPAKYNPIYWHESSQGDIVLDTGAPADTIQTWPNQGSAGGNLAEAVKSKQPLDSVLNGHRSAEFVKASQTKLVHSTAASNAKFLHDGTGCTMIMVFNFTAFDAISSRSFLFSTETITASTSIGVAFRETSNNGTLLVESFNGTATVIFNASAAGTLVVGTSHILTWRFDLAQATDFEVRIDGTSKIAANVTAAPSGSNPDRAPTIGCVSPPFYHADMHATALFATDSWLADADVLALEAYFARFK